MTSHERFMKIALSLAEKARDNGEVPIGAVIVKNGEIIGTGYNSTLTNVDPTAHAEIIAIREATKVEKNSRLINCDLYTTVEPCIMCAGAIIQARIKNLYIGTLDEKRGAIISNLYLHNSNQSNHKLNVNYGYLREECSYIISNFFKELRE